jgi:hypothetical protein
MQRSLFQAATVTILMSAFSCPSYHKDERAKSSDLLFLPPGKTVTFAVFSSSALGLPHVRQDTKDCPNWLDSARRLCVSSSAELGMSITILLVSQSKDSHKILVGAAMAQSV